MTAKAFEEFVQFQVQACCECGVVFAIPGGMYAQRLRDHKLFYCPNGHRLCFRDDTDVDRLKRELERERATRLRAEELRRAALREAEHNADELRRVEKRLRTVRERVKRGVCPCCKRSFVQLARHIATKHPGFEL